MVFRKILGNIVASLIAPLVFLIRWMPNVLNGVFYGEYEYYDFEISSLGELLHHIYGKGYFGLSFISLVIIFLPFQLIRNHYAKIEEPLSFIKRWIILASILLLLIVLFGTFSNIWAIPWYHNFIYIVYAIGFGLFFTALLHFLIDMHEETSKARLNKTLSKDCQD